MTFNWTWFFTTVGFCIIIAYFVGLAVAIANEKYRLAIWMGIAAAAVFCIVGGFVGGA